jgi:hypothetical protein
MLVLGMIYLTICQLHVGCLGELGGDGFFAIILPNKK